MANLGFATVSVIPTLKGGLQPMIDELGDVGKPAGEKAGSGMMVTLGKFGKAGAVAAGAAIIGALGKATSSGWDRLVAIEEAEARMRGLGFEASTVSSVMDSATNSVLGTTFSMAEAASVASMAVTAGVEPGQQLDAMLGTVANSAAAAGTSMSEMGSLFNKVATVDMAQMDVINQVSDRGINVLGALASQLGVTTDEVRTMASDGQIDFQMFSDAMGAATGTIAEELGNTVPGAISLATSALGRLGTAMLSPVYSSLQGAFLGLRDGIDWATQAIGPLAEAFTNFAGQALAYMGQSLAPIWQTIKGQLLPALQELWNIVGPVLTPVLQFLATTVLGVLKGAWDGVVMVIRGVIDVISGLASFVVAIFNGEWRNAWESLKQIVSGAITAVAGAIWTWANVTIIGAVRGGIVKLVGAFTGGWNGIKNIFTSSLGAIRGVVNTVWNTIVNFFRSGMTTAGNIVRNGMQVARSAFGGAFAAIRTVVSQAWAAISGFFRSGASTMVNLMRTGVNNLRNAVSSGISNVLSFFRSVPSKIRGALGNVGSLLRNSGRQLIAGFVSGIQAKFSDAVAAVKNGLQRVRNFFPFSPAKEGPFSGLGYTTHSGAALMSDWAAGMASSGRQAVKSAQGVVRDVHSALSAQAGVPAPIGLRTAVSAPPAGGATIHIGRIELPNVRDVEDFVRELQRLPLRAHMMGGIA